MRDIVVFMLLCFVSCSKNKGPLPRISSDVKAERSATIDSFVGEWEYYLNEKPYKKIVIEKKDSVYSFKHYIVVANQYIIDNVYYEQDFSIKSFVTWDKSPIFRPYITIESTYVSSESVVSYRVQESVHYLELAAAGYKKAC